MQTEKFKAPSMKEALAKVKEKFGDDAIILKSEKIRPGGSLNFLKNELIEVTAAPAGEVQQELQNGPDFAETLDGTLSKGQLPSSPAVMDFKISELTRELQRLRDDLGNIGNYIRHNNLPNMPPELTNLWEALNNAGIHPEWTTDLTQEALVNLRAEELISSQTVEDFLLDRIVSIVPPAVNTPVGRSKPYKIILVGPPGSGKTTLLQKLAVDPKAYGERRIGLVSLDTHRLAAIEQIKAFARIAGAPLEVVYRPEHVAEALGRLADREIILVDTPGCSHWDSDKRELLGGFLERIDPDEVHLVLNSSVRDEELITTCHRSQDLSVTHLDFTRIDETLRNACLLNVARSAGKPVAWLSRGQEFIGCLDRLRPDLIRHWILQRDTGSEKEQIIRQDAQTVEQAG